MERIFSAAPWLSMKPDPSGRVVAAVADAEGMVATAAVEAEGGAVTAVVEEGVEVGAGDMAATGRA
jgi:hypothetical protein